MLVGMGACEKAQAYWALRCAYIYNDSLLLRVLSLLSTLCLWVQMHRLQIPISLASKAWQLCTSNRRQAVVMAQSC